MAKKRKTPVNNNNNKTTTNGNSKQQQQQSKSTLLFPPSESLIASLLPNNKNKKANNNNKLQLKEIHTGYIWIIQNVLTKDECNYWITKCNESKQFEYTNQIGTKYLAQRECYRIQFHSPLIAQRLYERLTIGYNSIIDQLMNNTNDDNSPFSLGVISSKIQNTNYKPIGLNPNIRIYKYCKGHSFGKHIDDSNILSNKGKLGQQEKTEFTVLIYLSKCKGGATRFYPLQQHEQQQSKKNKSKSSSSSIAFEPEIGTMLLHIHGDSCLEHEADPVLDDIKYVLRTDIVFSNI